MAGMLWAAACMSELAAALMRPHCQWLSGAHPQLAAALAAHCLEPSPAAGHHCHAHQSEVRARAAAGLWGYQSLQHEQKQALWLM